MGVKCDPMGICLVVAVSQSHDPFAWQVSNHKTAQEKGFTVYRGHKKKQRETWYDGEGEREKGREGKKRRGGGSHP